jgi:glycosyltransferase involved in cell wall biosynthesis
LAGAKIVITPVGGTRDYFANDAIYVEPTSTESIVEGIQTALKNKKDNELRTRIEKEFLWDKVGERTKLVYEKILGQT